MNNNIKELIEQYINEEHIKLMNKFNGSNFLLKLQKLFQQKFKSKISIKVDIPGEQIVNDDFYERLMINVAGQLIEQYIAKFMINLFTSDTFKCKSGGITTERGKVHDFSIIFNGDKNKPYSQSFEVKSYNKFGNVTLSSNQRQESNVKNPIYILCDYELSKNDVIIHEVYFLLGSTFNKDIHKEVDQLFDDNRKLKSQHISTNFKKFLVYKY